MKTFGTIVLVLLAMVAISVLAFTCNTCNIAQNHVEESMKNAVVSYDEYQNIYNTCDQLNTDLGNLQSIPETDKQFDQITKSQRVFAIKANLNRWVTEYNAKSEHIDKKLWKSGKLPYRLDVNNYSNYNPK
jgi:hypothetical protein